MRTRYTVCSESLDKKKLSLLTDWFKAEIILFCDAVIGWANGSQFFGHNTRYIR